MSDTQAKVKDSSAAPTQGPSSARTRRAEPKSLARGSPREAQDAPGAYTVVHDNTAVTAERAAAPPTIAHLPVGSLITVVEVACLVEDNRVRGRIEEPPGWISLLDTSDGYRWAQPKPDSGAGRGSLGNCIPKDCLVPSRRAAGGALVETTESIVAELDSVHERLTLLFPEGPGEADAAESPQDAGRPPGHSPQGASAELRADASVEEDEDQGRRILEKADLAAVSAAVTRAVSEGGGARRTASLASLDFSFSHGLDPAELRAAQQATPTPRATLLVTPATPDLVGTVCRKPRPKAMQQRERHSLT